MRLFLGAKKISGFHPARGSWRQHKWNLSALQQSMQCRLYMLVSIQVKWSFWIVFYSIHSRALNPMCLIAGEPSVAATLTDIEAAYSCLLTRYHMRPQDIVLYGQSVGRWGADQHLDCGPWSKPIVHSIGPTQIWLILRPQSGLKYPFLSTIPLKIKKWWGPSRVYNAMLQSARRRLAFLLSCTDPLNVSRWKWALLL